MITEKTKKEFEEFYRMYSSYTSMAYSTANCIIKEAMSEVDFIEVDGEQNGLFSSAIEEYITGIENVDGKIYIKTAHECRPLYVLNVDEMLEVAYYIISNPY